MYTVEKGVPMPELKKHNGQKYPFATMSVGDSFLVKTDQDRNRALSAAYAHGSTNAGRGTKFQSRKAHGGYRIWRVA